MADEEAQTQDQETVTIEQSSEAEPAADHVSKDEYEQLQGQVDALKSQAAAASETPEKTIDEQYKEYFGDTDEATQQQWERDPVFKATKGNSADIAEMRKTISELTAMVRESHNRDKMVEIDQVMSSKFPDWEGAVRAKAIELARQPGYTGLSNDDLYYLAKARLPGKTKMTAEEKKGAVNAVKAAEGAGGSTKSAQPSAAGAQTVKTAHSIKDMVRAQLDEMDSSGK